MLLLAPLASAHVPFARGTTTVTELHAGPAAEGGQWFEVRNDSGAGQNLVEQVFTDADGDTFQVTLTVIVHDGERAVFASYDSTVDADYHFPAAFDLRPDAGAIVHSDINGVVDEVAWDAGWGVPSDAALQLDEGVASPEFADDLPGNWCVAAGTPGAANARCPGTDTDDDGDGYAEVDGDCDDANAAVHPGAYDGPTVEDDADCDGERDDDPYADTGTEPVDTAETGETGGVETGDSGAAESGTPDSAPGEDSVGRDSGGPPAEDGGCGGCGGGGGAMLGAVLLATASRPRPRRPGS